MRSAWVVLVLLGGCTDVKRSTLPPYVRDLRAAVGGVQMIQCQIVVTTTREQRWFTSGSKTTREIGSGPCWTQVVSTEPPPGEP